MTHLANQPPVAQSGYRYFGTGYSLGLKVHFKSRGLLLMGLAGASSTLVAGHWSLLPGGEEPVIAGRDPPLRFTKGSRAVRNGGSTVPSA
jgi:hypothetical protein